MSYSALRSRYIDTAVSTASPARLLTMLYDRLVLDLDRAESEQRAGRRLEAGPHLTHAQDVVTELASSLDVDAWDGAQQLLSVYTFLLTELVGANVAGDADRTAACRRLVEPLRDAWHEAGQQLAPATVTPLEPAAGVPSRVFGELGVG